MVLYVATEVKDVWFFWTNFPYTWLVKIEWKWNQFFYKVKITYK